MSLKERFYLNPFGSAWEAHCSGSVPCVTCRLVCLPHWMEAGLPTVYTVVGTRPCVRNKERTSVSALGTQDGKSPVPPLGFVRPTGPHPRRGPLQVWNGTDMTMLAPACSLRLSVPRPQRSGVSSDHTPSQADFLLRPSSLHPEVPGLSCYDFHRQLHTRSVAITRVSGRTTQSHPQPLPQGNPPKKYGFSVSLPPTWIPASTVSQEGACGREGSPTCLLCWTHGKGAPARSKLKPGILPAFPDPGSACPPSKRPCGEAASGPSCPSHAPGDSTC